MSDFLVSGNASSRQSQVVSLASDTDKSIQLLDKTINSRVGFRGKEVETFLISQFLTVPKKPNQACVSDSGLWVVRLSNTEFWVLDLQGTQAQSLLELEQKALGLDNLYRLYCQHSHAMFECVGEQSGSMFAKVCGVDLSHEVFAQGDVAQTSVARVNAIVVNVSNSEEESSESPYRYVILSDVSSSQHLWDALVDAAEEF